MDNERKGPLAWAIDFDGSLAHYDHFRGVDHLGDAVPEAVHKVQEARKRGEQVWIHTARISPSDDSFEQGIDATQGFVLLAQWCLQNIGELLPITNIKNRRWKFMMDDRGRELIPNTGVMLRELVEASDGDSNEDGGSGQDAASEGKANVRPAYRA